MKRLILIQFGVVFTCVLTAGASAAQQTLTSSELALDSLLMMPVSTASKYDQKQTAAPAFVTIITREEIRNFGYQTLEEVLSNQTGFYAGNDRQYSDVGFRGVGRPGYYNNKLLVLLDGHTLNDAFSGGARVSGALGVDLENVDRIELVRGPGSALYGARAMSAVVNLVTLKGRDLDGLELTGDVGSLGAYGGSARYGAVLGSKTDLAFSGSLASADGEDLYFPELDSPLFNHGLAEDLDWERRARGLVTLRHGELFVQASASRRDKGIPTGVYKTAFNHPDAESRDQAMFLEARYGHDVGPNRELTLRAFADSYDNIGTYPFVVGAEEELAGGGASRNTVESRSFGSEARLRWDPTEDQRLVVGLEGQRAHRAGVEILNPSLPETGGDHPYWIFSGFVQHEAQLTRKLTVTLGFRRDEYSTRGSATTPRGAVVFHASESSTFKLLAGDAFRAPNTLELFVVQPSAGLLGNPALDPERIRSIEGIWQQRFGAVATTLSLYHNEIRDLIDLVEVQAPEEYRDYGTLMFEQQNIQNVRARGLEFEARVAFPAGVMTRVGYGWARAVDRDSGAKALNSPEHQFRMAAVKDWGKWGTMGLTGRAESGRRTLYGTESDPMGVLDFTLSSRTPLSGLSFQLMAKNVLDAAYPLPGGIQHVQSVIPQPGRSLLLRAEVRW